MKITNLAGLKIHFYDNNSSSDEAIIFIHGNSHSLNTFRNQYSDPKLSTYRLIGLDLPGHGKSEHHTVYNLSLLADSVKRLIDHLGLTKVILVGHSLGGHVAIESLDEINPLGVMIFGTPPLTHPINLEGFKPNDKMGLLSQKELTDDEIRNLMEEFYEKYTILLNDLEEFKMTDVNFRPSILEGFLKLSFKDEEIALNRYKGKKAILHGVKDKVINSGYIEGRVNMEELWRKSIIYINSSHNLHVENSSEFNNVLNAFAEETFLNPYIQLNTRSMDNSLCL